MRRLSIASILAATLVSAAAIANPPKVDNLSKEIHELLSYNSIYTKNTDLTAKVWFTLTEEHEINVLYIQSNHMDVKRFLIRSLDQKKVSAPNAEIGKEYTVNVRITPKQSGV
nr:hypothetical protein [Allomuricauda sp.]